MDSTSSSLNLSSNNISTNLIVNLIIATPQRTFLIIYGFYFLLVLIITIQWLNHHHLISSNSTTKSSSKVSPKVQDTTSRSRVVPIVPASLPYIGHGLWFSLNNIGFIQWCRKQYGPIFQIKLFRRSMIIITDRNLASEYFKSTEDKLSFYKLLESLYFKSGFSSSQQSNFLHNFVAIVKGSIGIKYDLFVPKIHAEALRMMERLKQQCSSSSSRSNSSSQAAMVIKIDLIHEMMKFVCSTSSNCFIGLELSNEMLDYVLEFIQLFNKMNLATSYLPKWVIDCIWASKLKDSRMKINMYLQPEIQKYRKDPNKSDSLVIRTAVDYEDGDGVGLDNEEIGNILVCLLFSSTENSAWGLTNTIIDLVLSATPGGQHEQEKYGNDDFNYLEELKLICASCLSSNNIRGILESPSLHACIMESARLNTHILSLMRQPMSPNVTIEGYGVGHVSTIAFSPPILMVFGREASQTFKDPIKYNPKRFITDYCTNNNTDTKDGCVNDSRRRSLCRHSSKIGLSKESDSPYNVLSWGAGIHLCPGKTFALFEIKMALALLITNFQLEIDNKNLISAQTKNYFSPGAFAERNVKMGLRIL